MIGFIAYLKPSARLLGLAILMTLSGGAATAQSWNSFQYPLGEDCQDYDLAAYFDASCGVQAYGDVVLYAWVSARAQTFASTAWGYVSSDVDGDMVHAFATANNTIGASCTFWNVMWPDGDTGTTGYTGSNGGEGCSATFEDIYWVGIADGM